MPILPIRDIAIAYEDRGAPASPEAVPLLLLHGAVQTRAVWAAQIEALARTRRVIAPDLRGHGETPLGNLHLSVEEMARDCLELLDALNIPTAAVCGISLGGMVALDMTERAPHRVASLILSNTPLALSDRPYVRRLIDWIDPHRLLRPTFALIGQERSARIGLAVAKVVVGPHWVGKTARRHFIAGFATMSEDAIVATYRAIVECDPVDPAKLDCPCLVIEGAKDAPTVKEQSRDIADAAPDVRLTRLDVGHVANLDDPAAFNRVLIDFLERHDRGIS